MWTRPTARTRAAATSRGGGRSRPGVDAAGRGEVGPAAPGHGRGQGGRDPFGAATGDRLCVGEHPDRRLAGRLARHPPASFAAMRIASREIRSTPPASTASASRSTSVRRAARNARSSASTPSSQTADVDRLGLGGHVGAELGAAPLGEDLDPQRRAGGHRRADRPDDHRDLGPPGLQLADEPAMERRLAARPDDLAGAALFAAGRPGRERLDDRHPESRGEPGDVVDGLDHVRRPRAPASRRASRRSRRPA